MNLYERYENIFTYDDLAFNKTKLIPQTLSANLYLKYKNNTDFLKNKFNDKIDRQIIDIQNIYLFTFNRGKQSGGNFFHFHFHYLQKLIGFLELNDENIQLGIPLNMLEFQKLLILSIVPESKIVYLDIYRYNYNITNGYIGLYQNINSLPNKLFDIYQNIGLKYISNQISDYKQHQNINNLFIRRHNAGNAGINRYIINEDELIKYLNTMNFQYFYFEDYELKLKLFNLLKLKPKNIIIEIGAGLTNLLYFPKNILQNIKFIIIDQHNWKLKNSRIYDIITKLELNHTIITCNNQIINENDLQNNPFNVDINEINKAINSNI